MRFNFLWARKTRRIRLVLLLIVAAWCSLDALHAIHTLRASEGFLPNTPLTGRKIFIASLHWNSEPILREAWSDAILELVDALTIQGDTSNIFISIYESGSWDGTKAALQGLDQQLTKKKVPRQVILDRSTHADEIAHPIPRGDGWIRDGEGALRKRRIPYLAELRNTALEPLWEQEKKGITYDTILFLEDIMFTVKDVRALLNTNDGSYAAACAFDVTKAPLLYDTFALRDIEGNTPLMLHWPWFRAKMSRKAAMHGDPVPVRSCWNGMVVMNARPIYDKHLQFRALPDSLAKSHLEASECCLIHVDNDLSNETGVWMNPKVQVGYSRKAYERMHPRQVSVLSNADIVRGLWTNRLLRWSSTTWFKERVVDGRMREWINKDHKNKEDGRHCIVNEMQVLVENGWAHV